MFSHTLNIFILSPFLQAKKAKQAEIERKRAEVRKRMEEASKAKKAKKGFMTPERKKKLRVSERINHVNLPHPRAPPRNQFNPQPFYNTKPFLHFPSFQLLLRKKAAEELKKEQERKAAERRRIIEERCGRPKDVESASEGNAFINDLCDWLF